MRTQLPPEEFWSWFTSNIDKFEALVDSADPFWDEALERLQLINPDLWFELSTPSEDGREFVVTAQGKVDLFPLVDSLVALAPATVGWTFTALKPPSGFEFSLAYEGARFDPANMWFMPLSSSRASGVGLRIGVPDLKPGGERAAQAAVLVILDTAIGERSAALDIQHVEVCDLPKDPDAAGFLPLTDLVAFLAFMAKQSREDPSDTNG